MHHFIIYNLNIYNKNPSIIIYFNYNYYKDNPFLKIKIIKNIAWIKKN